ncbi:MAG: cupin domain-containing protein [Chloroflexi bacterium HGW-Chloroflexi-10]|nr:MAG: cupin domain-containing protein [Chloroflexi bacterium HGW-Chloroflexi-10]
MKIIKTFEAAEIPNPHFISVRALLVSDPVQFEHLSLEAGQVQKKHVAHTNVYLYILNGTGVLDAGGETISLFADMLVEIPPETPHRLTNNSNSQLRLLNIKAPRPTSSTQIITESEG